MRHGSPRRPGQGGNPVGTATPGTTGSTSGTFNTSNNLTVVVNGHDIFNESLSVTYGDLLLRIAQTTLKSPTNLPLTPT